MPATKIDLTEPDFLVLKAGIKNFLKSQNEFADADFEGSGMAVLLDILAYNTAYLAFYCNMVGNEMFLDSAVLPDSIASRAKMIGYRGRSRRSAVAYLDLEIIPDDSPSTVIIERGTKFTSVLDGITYTFSVQESFTIYPDDNGDFKIQDLPITEGEVLRHQFTVSDGDPNQRFILPNAGVDTTTIRVTLQESSSNLTSYVFQLAEDINVIDAQSRVYFLQAVGDKYEIYFGDGIIGKKPQNGNLIFVDYLVSHGEDANGLSSFQPANGVAGYSDYTLSTASKSSGGAEKEDGESIRKLAPLSYQAQGRAVTKIDYETLIKSDYPNVDSIRVWGGEENDPPFYGKVFICIKPLDSLVLGDQTKEYLVNTLIRRRNMVGVDVDIVDPDYVRLVITSIVKWRADVTADSEATVQATIRQAIIDYGNLDLDNFDTYFRYSKFTQKIDTSHPAVRNNLTTVKLRYRLEASLINSSDYTINFSNAVDPNDTATGEPTLTSSSFTLDGYTCFFDDDGAGVVRIFRILEGEKVFVRANIGSIDYNTGRVQLNNFLPTAIQDNLPYITLTVRPLYQDVVTVRGQLLIIDEPSIFIDMIDESMQIKEG